VVKHTRGLDQSTVALHSKIHRSRLFRPKIDNLKTKVSFRLTKLHSKNRIGESTKKITQ
jgi:hypothetical protein